MIIFSKYFRNLTFPRIKVFEATTILIYYFLIIRDIRSLVVEIEYNTSTEYFFFKKIKHYDPLRRM